MSSFLSFSLLSYTRQQYLIRGKNYGVGDASSHRFAFIVVFITASVVAFIANHFIPGFSIPLGFLLGGIVSPPDAVSAAAIMKFVKVPQRISAILEGESLFNDASSLIIVKFALISVGSWAICLVRCCRRFLVDGCWWRSCRHSHFVCI